MTTPALRSEERVMPLEGHPLDRRGRTIVTVADVATHLDRRLYADESPEALRAGCAAAVRHGIGAVITLPEHVPTAAAAVAGSGVGVATALQWHGDDTARLDTGAVLDEADQLVGRGATEIAYMVTRERLQHGDEVADHVAQLVDRTAGQGARVRAILATDDLTDDEIGRACHGLAAAGTWMVQGGSWRARRTGLSQLELMRAELPSRVLLKWTDPVKNIGTLLLALSMGVDRFNCDVDEMLADARRSEWLAPLTIPAPGIDY